MTPAVGETPVGVKTTAFGVLKLARFKNVEEFRPKLQVQLFRESACL